MALLDLSREEAEQALAQQQARLPQRLGELGLRSSTRTAPAAYWASLADCLQPLHNRYPELATRLLAYLKGNALNTLLCLVAAQQAVAYLDA